MNKSIEEDFGFDDSLESLQDKCGVFGAIANGDWPTTLDVAHIICLGLVGLQHRGQESAGIITCKWNHEQFAIHRGMGLVSQVFNEPIMMTLKGNLGIGHTRYSTMGGADNVTTTQPFVVHTSYGTLAVAHNGELVNSSRLRARILANGVGLSTGSDTELITQALSMEPPQQFRQYVTNNPQLFHSMNNQNYCQNCCEKQSNDKQLMKTNSDNNTNNSCNNSVLNQKDSDFVARVLHLMHLTPLSYSLTVMYDECIYAIRDPFGNRPLCLGALVPPNVNNNDITSSSLSSSSQWSSIDGWVVSSESCSFPSVCAKLYRDVQPGEIVKLEKNKPPKTLALVPRPDLRMICDTRGYTLITHYYFLCLESPPAFCIFEYVYFARPDSMMEGQMVYAVRQKCGQQLAIEAPVVNNESNNGIELIVAPVPESSIPAALGYSQQSGLRYVEVFCKNRYVGRSFIQPSMRLRRLAVAKKFGPLSLNFKGKSIVLIDDSIVRGTTIGQLIRLLKESGACDVHIRIASPPLHFPCYMGINIPTKEELIANHLKAEQLAQTLGASSLVYLSVDGLKKSVQSGIREQHQSKYNSSEEEMREKIGHCCACLTGQYPVKLTDF